MAFKSKAHRDKFQELLKNGDITPEKYAEFEKDTPKILPDRYSAPPIPAKAANIGKVANVGRIKKVGAIKKI